MKCTYFTLIVSTLAAMIATSSSSWAEAPMSPAERPYGKAECGFSSRSELLAEAQNILDRTSTLSISAYGLVAEDASSDETEPGAGILPIIDDHMTLISEHPALRQVVESGLLRISYSSPVDCENLPCASARSFTVFMPSTWLTDLNRRTTPEDFRQMTLNMLGHEVGHHIYSAIFRTDSEYPRVTLDGPLTPLKYHLIVDAIGILIARSSIDSMIASLETVVRTSTFQGDGARRLRCLKILQ